MTSAHPEKTVNAAFDILDWQEAPYDEPAAGPRLTRVTITKRYHGAIEGTGVAEVLTARGDDGGGYLASERIIGTLDGREGTFVVQHGGLADGTEQSTFGTVIPHSGTGELLGLRGRATEAATACSRSPTHSDVSRSFRPDGGCRRLRHTTPGRAARGRRRGHCVALSADEPRP